MKTLCVIDLMPFLYRGHFVFLTKPRITSTGLNTSALIGFVNGVLAVLKELSPTLVERTPLGQPTVSMVSGAAHDPFGQPAVSCLLKRQDGVVTLIAVNAAPAPAMARFGIAGSGAADVLWEKRTVPFGANGLEDAFEPFAVHVYQWREPFLPNGLAARSSSLNSTKKGTL